jgi:DNA-directed RNA polymerase specialized sigma24 family protein
MTIPAERFRSYLYLLAQSRLARNVRANADLSGIVQKTLFEAHQAWSSVAEVAQVSNRSKIAVASLLYRALKRLHQELPLNEDS